jgi:hypothetical protein
VGSGVRAFSGHHGSFADPGLQPGGRMVVKARRSNHADLPIVKEQPARSWSDTRAGSKCNPSRTPCSRSRSRSRFRRAWSLAAAE